MERADGMVTIVVKSILLFMIVTLAVFESRGRREKSLRNLLVLVGMLMLLIAFLKGTL